MSARRRLAALALAVGVAGAAQADAPPPGRYAAQFCVAVGDAQADCGPAQVEVRRARKLAVRIADLAYHLELASSQVDVVLMHGSMQIDGFFASYEWDGRTLRFLDLDKHTRYALEIAPLAPRR